MTEPYDPQFAKRLMHWHKSHGRHDLPWQRARDPYRVWVSEIMLQQTQVASVMPYFERFVERFPDVASLAAADLDDVLASWSGLGYYRRARNLHAAAQIVVREHRGVFPRDLPHIADLPGIGRSTAGAIAALAFGERAAILDGNVKRVLSRYFGIEGYPGTRAIEARLWAIADALLPEHDVAVYTQALMDLGATVCRRRAPNCAACPLGERCFAHCEGRTHSLPCPRPPRQRPEQNHYLVCLWHGDRVLLEHRPPTGVWGGLMSLPELPETGRLNIADWCARTLGCEIDTVSELPVMRHELTHFRMNLIPLVATVINLWPHVAEEPRFVWQHREALSARALPAPIRRLLLGMTTDRTLMRVDPCPRDLPSA
ncbi:MAG: A/G-specific adenine glycosylase [Betaproteobacteria bacterium]|nr:A/G-specific adenine glycosylase [Rhodocyclaceae bacterium]MCG3185906.1 Adenine DNA glycosylase [Rhodocyclaceae bacterium]